MKEDGRERETVESDINKQPITSARAETNNKDNRVVVEGI
tara:strand:+ start:472 stop:591 length:120 start_codon:yes stop_codon:yes gene_type:complete